MIGHSVRLRNEEAIRNDAFGRPIRGREFFEAVIRENIWDARIMYGRQSPLYFDGSGNQACYAVAAQSRDGLLGNSRGSGNVVHDELRAARHRCGWNMHHVMLHVRITKKAPAP